MKTSDKKTEGKTVKTAKTEKILRNIIPVPHENYVRSGTHYNCSGCGHWLMSEFEFCPKCGNKIAWKDSGGCGINIDNY